MTRRRLPGDAKDAQSRYIEAAVNVRPRLKVAGVDRAVRGKPETQAITLPRGSFLSKLPQTAPGGVNAQPTSGGRAAFQ